MRSLMLFHSRLVISDPYYHDDYLNNFKKSEN